MFKPVDKDANFPQLEARVRKEWESNDIFKKSVEQRPEDKPWGFYEGPPSVNGLPGIHHALARAYKDLFPRFKTMRGYRVERKAGWDEFGLPVELAVEKKLGFKNKQDIEAFGVEEFTKLCKEVATSSMNEWVEFSNRMAFWADYENAYHTSSSDYVESVWWFLKQIYDKGLLYKGYRVAPYCTRCQTSLSSHELSQGYRDNIKDPSCYPMFEWEDEPGTYFLVWTTTPWTLPGHVALAVNPEMRYVKVRNAEQHNTQCLVLAKDCLSVLDGEYEVLEEFSGESLVGKKYRTLFDCYLPKEDAFRVVAADFVSSEEGTTGVVHLAPAYGEEDFAVAKKENLPVRHCVTLEGLMMADVPVGAGVFAKDADVALMVYLKENGHLYKKGTVRHTYPFCWRCETPLLYYAMDSWFVEMTKVRERMLENNAGVNWVPEHVKEGRFGNWLLNVADWNLSRARYWATPLPVWICEDCEAQVCVGSRAELGLEKDADLHRPYVDNCLLDCECGGKMRRVPYVVDVWMDSGCVPFAQYHYPFENKEFFESRNVADFLSEAVDQTRGWFYSLLAVSTLMQDCAPYKNVVCLSHVVDEQGQKMAKSRGNTMDPMAVMDNFGADAMRWYFYSTASVGNEYRVGEKSFQDVVRRFSLLLWNTYRFFVDYANLDGYSGLEEQLPLEDRSVMDRWVLSELNQTVQKVTEALESFDATSATRKMEDFVTDLSTWYVRRSRERFWKAKSDSDKLAAYQTLHFVLLEFSKLLAPFMPFLSEVLYSNLSLEEKESVHLADWPLADGGMDAGLMKEMTRARKLTELIRAERSRAQLKVRQPLQGAVVPGESLSHDVEKVVLEEVNLKELSYDPTAEKVVLDTNVTYQLLLEGLARETVRMVQDLRKDSGLNVNDRVILYYSSNSPKMLDCMKELGDYVGHETLALEVNLVLNENTEVLNSTALKVGENSMWVGLRKVGD